MIHGEAPATSITSLQGQDTIRRKQPRHSVVIDNQSTGRKACPREGLGQSHRDLIRIDTSPQDGLLRHVLALVFFGEMEFVIIALATQIKAHSLQREDVVLEPLDLEAR